MLLSSFFDGEGVLGDADVQRTHYVNSPLPDACAFALNDNYLSQALSNPNIVAVIVPPGLVQETRSKGVYVSENPKRDFFRLHEQLYRRNPPLLRERQISLKAQISPLAVIHGNVLIEDDVIIEDFAVVRENSIIRRGAYIAAHAVIGARGMHDTFVDGERLWVSDAGGVLLEEGVQVLSHASVQKAYFAEFTSVGRNSIVSVHCNIGHGCRIGANTRIAGSAQLAGYVTIGDNVWVGPSVTVAHGLSVGDGAELLIGSVVISDIASCRKVSGNFAIDHLRNIKLQAEKRSAPRAD